jgi:2-haloacid dehalogenase
MDFGAISAISFDCYGTLIDWEAGIASYVAPILQEGKRPDVTVRQWIEQWERIQFQMLHPYRPYREILARSFDATMRHFGIAAFLDGGPGLARSVDRWPPFPDSTTALRRLARRFRLAIVSNIDDDLLAGSVGQLLAPLSSLVTSEQARAYKPAEQPFRLLLERLQLEPHRILHAAFGWKYDLEAAHRIGLRTCFVNRSGLLTPMGFAPDVVVPSLSALSALLDPLSP